MGRAANAEDPADADIDPAAVEPTPSPSTPSAAPPRDAEPDHTGVEPSPDGDRTVSLALTAEPSAVRDARRFVSERWSWLDDDVLADVELVVTELVSNAVRHGRPEIELRLRVEPFAVDVAVLDHGDDQLPEMVEQAGADARSGRGLAIVDQLANFWGVEHDVDDRAAKLVWASLTRPH